MVVIRKYCSYLVSILLLSTVLLASSGCEQKVVINISAASSLKNALDEITALFLSEYDSIIININYGSSGTLQTQIINRAPCDIFISASSAEMDYLQNKNRLLPNSRLNLLTNKIVLVVPHDSALEIASFEDLVSEHIKIIAIGAPDSVPVGFYAKQTLEFFGIYEQLKHDDKLVSALSAAAVLYYIASGNVDAGIVFATDAESSDKVSVVAVAPDEINDLIAYPVAIIDDSKVIGEARAYINFLFSEKAKAIFEKHGFIVIEQ